MPGWSWKRPIALSVATVTNDYQVRVDLTTNTFNYAHADAAGNDLRFEGTNALASLPYWIQNWTDSGTSTVWVAVPTVGTTGFTMYYGKVDAPAASSGTNTFIFFDDFNDNVVDTARWNKGGSMTESGGYVSGTTSGTDWMLGKTRIPIDTLTLVRMRNKAAPNSGVARPGVLTANGNPYNTTGFGWQDYDNGNRYTDTYEGSVNQVNRGTYNTNWCVLEATWQSSAVKFYVNGSLLGTHTTQLPLSSRVLYCQVEGNAYYDFVFSRRYVSSEPVATVGAEQASTLSGAPLIVNVGVESVAADAASLVGNLTTGDAPVEVFCYWGTTDGGDVASAWGATNDLGTRAWGYVTNSLTELTGSTRYYFRFYATNATDDAWVPVTTSFSTLGQPVVDNDGGATAVGQTSATLRGTLVAGNPSPTVWIHWGTSDGGTTPDDWNKPAIAIGQPGLANFNASVSGLEANRTYWYRCCASNDYGTVWAPASTNFTTVSPSLAMNDIGVVEGSTTTAAVFTVALSALSATDVSVAWAASDGTATAGGDYTAASGTLSVPAGNLTGQIAVSVVGDLVYEANETFYVNLSSPAGATVADSQGLCTITNDDWTFYVRGDGAGSDAYNGGSWSAAYATLNKALSMIPGSAYDSDGNSDTHGWQLLSTPKRICVQASAPAQAYDVATRNQQGAWDIAFQGGWENVDTPSPAQTGYSTVKDLDGTVDEPGIGLFGAYHGQWRRTAVNRFVFTNVTRGVDMTTGSGSDAADIFLSVSNSTIYARREGLYVDYGRTYIGGYGGFSTVWAENVNIVAGLDGTAGRHGISVLSPWQGCGVTASGIDPLTGTTRVSTVTSATGCGVYFYAANGETDFAAFSNVVVQGCASNAIYLQSVGPVQARLNHGTVADNAFDGLAMRSATAGNWAQVTNCVFAANGGAGIALGVAAPPSFSCVEGYNVFFDDFILTNGVLQAFASTTAAADPQFKATGLKPSPWYTLGSRASPAFRTATDGGSRGAYQNEPPRGGTLLLLF